MTDDRDKKSRTAGVVYVAFGRNYNHQAAFSAKSVRRLSDIPICVFTNIKMEPAWDGLDGVEAVTVDGDDKDNRKIKTTLHRVSPFRRTLYLDADTLVQKLDFLLGFDMLDAHDLLGRTVEPPLENVSSIRTPVYRQAHKVLGYTFPVTLINGGVLFFHKCPAITALFRKWHHSWRKLGSGRDMPSLAWAIQQVPNLRVRKLGREWNSPTLDKETIIAHAWGPHAIKGIPKMTKYIPTMQDNTVWRRQFKGADLS